MALIAGRADVIDYLDHMLKGICSDTGADLTLWAERYGMFKGVRGGYNVTVIKLDGDTFKARVSVQCAFGPVMLSYR